MSAFLALDALDVALDIVLVACVVAAAVAFLAWRLLGHGPPPACHQTAPAAARGGATGDDVILGDALQRGLARARARKLAQKAQK